MEDSEDTYSYFAKFYERLAQVFKQNTEQIYNHLKEYPWLTGAIGNPFSGIFFVAEIPSFGQVERDIILKGGQFTPESQWFSTRGDILFRQMLVKYGFKNGTIDSHGDWNCYITDVIKSVDYAEKWKKQKNEHHKELAELWSEMLAWELETGKPKLFVIMGRKVNLLINYLLSKNRLPKLPTTIDIPHYAYIGQRADSVRRLGPMHPIRIKEYDDQFSVIRKTFMNLNAKNQ